MTNLVDVKLAWLIMLKTIPSCPRDLLNNSTLIAATVRPHSLVEREDGGGKYLDLEKWSVDCYFHINRFVL